MGRASDGAAAWMRGRPSEGEGFRLDPDDASDHGRGLAVVGAVAWWRGAPVIHVESVRMTGVARGPDPEAPEGLLLVRRYRVSGP